MSNVRVDVGYTIKDGVEIKFRSPVDCSKVTGLIVYYPGLDRKKTSKVFAFADAHGNNVGDIDHLFAENAVVKVILDVTTGMAFVQNADTNAYLEAQFKGKAPVSHLEDKTNPHGVTAVQVGSAPAVESAEHPGCYYRTVDGVAEWINPPMELGVEYRTTDRYKGKPVYTKLDNFGEGPAEGVQEAYNLYSYHDGDDIHNPFYVFRNQITLERDSDAEGVNFTSIPLPFKSDSKEVFGCVETHYSMGWVRVTSVAGDFSDYDVYAQLWYYY